MKEPYTEGAASHGDPESCDGGRKASGEALTGAHTGGVLSRENNQTRVPTTLPHAEGETPGSEEGERTGDPARSKTSSTCGNSMRENREIPCSTTGNGAAMGEERTGTPWSRVPRDGKSGEGAPKYRDSLGISSRTGETGRLSRNECLRLMEALQVAIGRCQERGISDQTWKDMLTSVNMGIRPANLGDMRNLLKGIIGYDPTEESPQGGRKPTRPPTPTRVRAGKVVDRNPAMYEHGKSDSPIVPTKPANKAGRPAAEVVEERGLTKENVSQQNTPRTQNREEGVPSALERVRQAAIRSKAERFSALLHHITMERLRSAFFKIKKDAKPGVDGVTWWQYEAELEDNLRELHAGLHRGAYRAKPSRRAYIPKPDGRQRPLGVAALEDKIVQRAVVEVLNAIYEVDFLGFSYGFRPGRQAHEALDALAVGIRRKKINWILDADIRAYFDTLNHDWMMKFLEQRIADRRVLRLIQKWLKAGVVEDGKWRANEEGSPQGASVSPFLANVYLHYVLDQWVQEWRNNVARGEVIIVRWADDFVIGFQHEAEARLFLEELRARMQTYGLELHPEKTRLIRFGRTARQDAKRFDGQNKPPTFNFLGFTHHCGVTRNKKFAIWRITIKKRLCAKLKAIKADLRKRICDGIVRMGRWLKSVLKGYYEYHAIPGNGKALDTFRTTIARLWYKTLRRRSDKTRLTWNRMTRLVKTWLPSVRILHPWPEQRFDARYPR
jgi:RNA-directed DNA polymerase